MLLRYFYNKQLAQASYLVGCQSAGIAIVIDPGRNIDPYIEEAEAEGLKIIAAAETHIHADFVSGARELADRLGARLYLSDEGDANWKYQYLDGYDHQLVRDGDSFMIGNLKFEVMHTPGHTPEHISFLLTDTAAADQPIGVFTGDFVFVGSIGRPDLLEKAAHLEGTADIGARQQFQSVQRFKQLPDYLQVWPAHGAGSACGKGLGAVPSSTVGYEKLFNAALGYDNEDTFVRALLDGQPEAPKYFAVMKRVNKEGPRVLGGRHLPAHLPYSRIDGLLDEGAQIVDMRSCERFAGGHIPGTINIPYASGYTNWAGWLVNYDRPLYLIVDTERVAEVVGNLAEVGIDNVVGYWEPGAVDGWMEAGNELACYPLASPGHIQDMLGKGQATVIDVRGEEEFAEGHLPDAHHIMLGYLPERATELKDKEAIVLYCVTGVRSAIAASVLQAHGVRNVINIAGGIAAWRGAGLPIVN